MVHIDDIQDAIETIRKLTSTIHRRKAQYAEQCNRLQSMLEGIAHLYGFSLQSVTQVMTSPVRPGDYSILVAGWVYRQRIKLANSQRRVNQVTDCTRRVTNLYSMDQIRSWTNKLSCDDISQETLQRIGRRTIPTPPALFLVHSTLNEELLKLRRRVQRIEDITPERGIALLMEGGDDETSDEEDGTEDDSSDED